MSPPTLEHLPTYVRAAIRSLVPVGIRRWYHRDVKLVAPRILRLAKSGPTSADRIWIRLLAITLPIKHLVPRWRNVALPLRVDRWTIWVTDWSEAVVVEEIVSGQYELITMPDRAAVIVDLGANVGVSALYFHARYPDARVIGYEPDPRVHALAARNTRRSSGVTVHNAAVAANSGTLPFFRTAGQSWGGSLFERANANDRTISVQAVTLDDIVEECGHVDILKIDIEGAEASVLDACTRLHEIDFIVGEFHAIDGARGSDFLGLLRGFEVLSSDLESGKGQFVARRCTG